MGGRWIQRADRPSAITKTRVIVDFNLSSRSRESECSCGQVGTAAIRLWIGAGHGQLLHRLNVR